MGGRLELLGIVVKQQKRYGPAHTFRGRLQLTIGPQHAGVVRRFRSFRSSLPSVVNVPILFLIID
jgi:hypothetical protein